jgi:ERCC4-type nuclease
MITVDDREAGHDAHASIMEMLRASDVDVFVQRMEFADYAWTAAPWPDNPAPRIGVEVTTLSDLMGKAQSGRLGYQATGLLDNYDRAIWILKEKLYIDRRDRVRMYGTQRGYVSLKELNGILMGMADVGITPWLEEGDSELVTRLLHWYESHQKPFEAHKLFRDTGVRTPLARPMGEALDDHVFFLMGTPSKLKLGEGKMRAALDMHGSIQNVVNASVADLVKVPRWGKQTAERFKAFVERDVR